MVQQYCTMQHKVFYMESKINFHWTTIKCRWCYCSSGGLCLSVPTHPSNQLEVQTLQKLLSRVDATILTGGKFTVSQSKAQTWRPWRWRRLSLWLTPMTDVLEGRRVTSSWKQSGRGTPIRQRSLVLSNNADSRTAGWWMWPVTPMWSHSAFPLTPPAAPLNSSDTSFFFRLIDRHLVKPLSSQRWSNTRMPTQQHWFSINNWMGPSVSSFKILDCHYFSSILASRY